MRCLLLLMVSLWMLAMLTSLGMLAMLANERLEEERGDEEEGKGEAEGRRQRTAVEEDEVRRRMAG